MTATITLGTRDGLALHWREWHASSPKGTILMVHGHGEHIGRYAHVADFLNKAGWSVLGYDQRGHGASPGPRGRLNQADDLLHDLAGAVDLARQRQAAGPLVVLGHSMGGVTVMRFALGQMGAEQAPWARTVEGYAVSSPAIDVAPNFLQTLMLRFGNAFMPNVGASNGLKSSWVSRDPAEVAKYDADPLVHGTIAPRLAQFMIDSGKLVLQQAKQWHVPTLLVYAGRDLCVSADGSARFAKAASRDWVTSRVFPELYHEIFNEPERQAVFAELGAWLDRHFGKQGAERARRA